MTDPVYQKLAQVLDTLPNGFPATKNGLEIRILEKIFTPAEADLFCDLRLAFETPAEIAQRTGRPIEGLADRLSAMWQRGQIFGVDFGTDQVYRMLPWLWGIFEFQLKHMDKELAQMWDEYYETFGPQFFSEKPQLMQVIPIEKEIEAHQEALPYEQVSSIIENGQSFAVNECICEKEKQLLEHGCGKPLERCMAVAPIPGVFEGDHPWGGRAISKEEAYEVLRKAEEVGLVHMTGNVTGGHIYICNCCGDCCGVLRSINQLGIHGSVNSRFYAEIDADECVACGLCADERCQVHAIEEGEETYRVITEKCIGCGLCVTTCPSEAITLLRKKDKDYTPPPVDETEWYRLRGEGRGVDFSKYL